MAGPPNPTGAATPSPSQAPSAGAAAPPQDATGNGPSAPPQAPRQPAGQPTTQSTEGPASEPTTQPEEGWDELVSGQWTLPPGTESYVCVYMTLQEPIAFRALRPESPPGTHHTLLSYFDAPEHDDGTVPCSVSDNGDHILAATGVGTEATQPLPEGVSFQLPAGSQLLLNLHLYNATDDMLSGRTGITIKRSETPDVDIRAEHILAGPLRLQIPPGEATQMGRCTFTGDATVVEIFPHMHQLGSHIRVVAHSTTQGERVLHDADYDFEEQLFYPIEPLEMAEGDHVTVECTYQNDTGQTVTFGDSSDSEMCFAGLIRYPALGGSLKSVGGTLGLLCTF